MLVVMLGGCTLAEMAAMRADAEKHDQRLVILTTAIVNGNTLMRSFVPDAADLASQDALRTAQEL